MSTGVGYRRADFGRAVRKRLRVRAAHAPRLLVHMLTASTALVAAAGLAVAPSAAGAATPPPGLSPVVQRGVNVVTADALPTVQIDGVVWSQVVVGNTVYAGGDFTTARPAGSAPGQSTVPRSSLLAYDITTGALISSFAPTLNGQVRSLALSPDHTRLYAAGDFSQVNGVTHNRIVAFNPATGAVVTAFKGGTNSGVKSVVATNSTVYVGGLFATANGVARKNLAAFQASDGSLTAWAPSADYKVNALALTLSGSRVVVGGAFANISGHPAYGLGMVDAVSGAFIQTDIDSVVRDAGTQAAILSLTVDATAIYGTGYVFGSGGNFEGTFSADPTTGDLNWIEDCHGDTYGVFPTNGTVYTVSHAHFCGNIGAYPENLGERVSRRAVAFTAKATGTVFRNTASGYHNFGGQPSPSVVDWFPSLAVGSYTGQQQAAWDVSGNAHYVVLGGEFPSVNGTAQQGLVRFGVPSVTTSAQGPMVSGADFRPALRAVSSTAVRVSWRANWDRDDQNLTYTVIRDGQVDHPIYTTTEPSQWWNRPIIGTVDTGLTPGSTHTYFITAADPDGHQVQGNPLDITLLTSSPSAYAQQIPTDGAAAYYRFDEPSGVTTADDASGSVNLSEGSGVTGAAGGAILNDSDTAATFSGSSSGTAWTPDQITAPNTYSLEAWFKTTFAGGKIIGFGDTQDGSSSQVDRQIYLNSQGQLTYGVYSGRNTVLTTPGAYNDGVWHQVVATLSSAGMELYVDGTNVASNAAVTNGRPVSGYWRIGGDSLAGWPLAPSNPNFAGTLDEVAIYPYALSLDTVQNHYVLSGRTPAVSANPKPVAAFTSSCTNVACSFDGSRSQPSSGATISSYAWTFGDGKAGNGSELSHRYGSAGSYHVTLTVSDSAGRTASITKSVSVTAARTAVVRVLPTSSRHRLKSGWTIARRATGGSCSSGGSRHIPGADRCVANHHVEDPCWPLLTAAGRYRGSYCPSRPWSKSGPLLAGHHNRATHKRGHKAWGLQTASGVRCYSLSGAADFYRGKAVDWACTDKRHALLARPDTRQPQWRIMMVNVGRHSRYSRPRTVVISRAWVGISPYGA